VQTVAASGRTVELISSADFIELVTVAGRLFFFSFPGTVYGAHGGSRWKVWSALRFCRRLDEASPTVHSISNGRTIHHCYENPDQYNINQMIFSITISVFFLQDPWRFGTGFRLWGEAMTGEASVTVAWQDVSRHNGLIAEPILFSELSPPSLPTNAFSTVLLRPLRVAVSASLFKSAWFRDLALIVVVA
jgi:hypothetical protein